MGRCKDHSNRRFHQVAYIDEARCVGCTRCLEVCVVDAIIGAHNLMHTVIAAECIGCKLCLEPCPVDCIEMVPAPAELRPQSIEEIQTRGQLAKARYRARQARLAHEAAQRRARLEARKATLFRKQAS